jgi:hypothetical protein
MRTGRTVLALGALLAAAVFVGRLASFEIVCDVERMKENVRLENARVLSEARDGYRRDHGAPPANDALLVAEGYIRAAPVNP